LHNASSVIKRNHQTADYQPQKNTGLVVANFIDIGNNEGDGRQQANRPAPPLRQFTRQL
jgi:hypothetical protein